MKKRYSELKDAVESLRQMRDELRLQMHLGEAEARDEWERLESRWKRLRAEMDHLDQEVGEVSKEVGAAGMMLAEEIREGYRRLRERLKK